jgi:hypothetical protein
MSDMSLYESEFNVDTILMDGKCEEVKDELLLVVCNTTAAKEHISKAKCSICKIKEPTRAIIGTHLLSAFHEDSR